jgi:predicted ATP-grasp superfamily ATP-dependent carboligase
MKIFIYEYTCATPCRPSLAESLRTEGMAILTAVLADFERIDGVQPHTLLADDCHSTFGHVCERSGSDEHQAFVQLVSAADHTLVIAPEFDALLETRCRWVLEAGGRTLNSTPQAIRLTADKLQLANHFEQRRIPTPTACQLPSRPRTFPAVLKPRYGAGSQATFLVNDEAELQRSLDQARAEEFAGEFIVQPFAAGLPASVAMLLGPCGHVMLWPAAQHLSTDGRFRYLGGTVPLPERYWQRAMTLAERAAASVPGLCGYVGVDLVLGDADDGSADAVIEINPRLTTSYIGLRQIASVNLAEWLLALATGQERDFPSVLVHRRRGEALRFFPDGRWEWDQNCARFIPPQRNYS